MATLSCDHPLDTRPEGAACLDDLRGNDPGPLTPDGGLEELDTVMAGGTDLFLQLPLKIVVQRVRIGGVGGPGLGVPDSEAAAVEEVHRLPGS